MLPYLDKLFHLQPRQARRQEPLPCPPQPTPVNIPQTPEILLPGTSMCLLEWKPEVVFPKNG